ncbi:MAG TPA: hypothetical protein VG410_05660 [Solirubrobacteraceae bacterium]|nr:hypothetical protein [Solirubrobacteraceae bacterium]
MEFQLSRLRRGEWIVGGGAVVLAAVMFLTPWYGVKSPLGPTAASLGGSTSWDGWNGLTNLRWLVLLTILVAFALVWLQATRRAPALPVTFGVILTLLSLLTTLALIYRVLIDVPGAGSVVERKAGGFVGILATIAICAGGYLSLREEGVASRDEQTEVERVSLDTPTGATTGNRSPAPGS